MRLAKKTLLALYLCAHLAVTLAEAEAKAEAQAVDGLGSGGGRRLVVRKRKRPSGFGPPITSPEFALAQLQRQAINTAQDSRSGKSIIGRTPFQNFGPRTHSRFGHQASSPLAPSVSHFNSNFLSGRDNPFRARGASAHHQHQQSIGQRVQSAVVHRNQEAHHGHVAQVHAGHAPQVPGLEQHQAALRRHQEQIQAHLGTHRRVVGSGSAHIVPIHQERPAPIQPPRTRLAGVLNPPPAPAPAQPAVHVHHHQAAPEPIAVVDHSVHIAQEPVALHVDHHLVDHHVDHHVDHVALPVQPIGPAVIELEPVGLRQGAPEPVAIDLAAVAVAGERCVDKIVNVEETEVDENIECHHSYDQKCHTTYTTDFEPQQEEKCEENFKKNCFIEYKTVAQNETVEFCHTPLVKDCNVPGPVECKTEYESECETRYHKHVVEEDIPECVTIKEVKCETKTVGYSTEEDCKEWPVERCNIRTEIVEKATPETACKKVPKEKCAPAGCGFVPGVPECFDKTETVISEVPEEKCDLEPTKHCKHVTTLVPSLKPEEECVDVPKEVCTRSQSNPRKVTKPVVKKWCYTPTPESGLF